MLDLGATVASISTGVAGTSGEVAWRKFLTRSTTESLCIKATCAEEILDVLGVRVAAGNGDLDADNHFSGGDVFGSFLLENKHLHSFAQRQGQNRYPPKPRHQPFVMIQPAEEPGYKCCARLIGWSIFFHRRQIGDVTYLINKIKQRRIPDAIPNDKNRVVIYFSMVSAWAVCQS